MSKTKSLKAMIGAACQSSPNREGVRLCSSLATAAGIAALGCSTSLFAQETASSSGMEVFETFTATGQGESRASNSLNLEALEIAIPGQSPFKILDKIPGVSVISRDPFGHYESVDVRVRAFDIQNLGVTLDGVPVGTSSSRYGTPVTRLVDSQNLQTVKVSQGAGDVTTPAYQALGGSLQYFSKDPSKEKGAYVSATYGSFDHLSLFGKFEFGEILPGLTGNISSSHFEFTPRGLEGLGKGYAKRLEGKFKYDLPSDNGSLTYAVTYNDRDDFDTSGLDYGEWIDIENGNYRGTGQGYIEYTPWDYPTLGAASNYGDLTDKGRNYGPPAYIDPNKGPGEGTNSQYYNLWRNGRMDLLHRMKLDLEFENGGSLSVVPYYQDKNNYGLYGRDRSYAENQVRLAYEADPNRTDIWSQMWYNTAGEPVNEFGEVVSPFASSGNNSRNPATSHAIVAPGTPAYTDGVDYIPGISGRTGRDENFGGYRYGTTVTYEWETDNNKLVLGGWYEFDYHSTERPNMNLEGGSILGGFEYEQFNFMNYTRYIDQDVVQFWLQDTFTTMEGKLDIIAGVKAITLNRNARGFLTINEWINNTETNRSTTYEDLFLPQFGLLYALNDSTELFFNYSENMATPDSGTITTAGDTFNPDILKPEYSENFDLGVRGNYKGSSYSLQAYKISYDDRILSSTVPLDSPNAGAAGNSVYQNVGGVDSWGMEASGEFPTGIDGLSFSGSIGIQKTTFQEDLLDEVVFIDAGDPVPTAPAGYRVAATSNPLAYEIFLDISGNDLGNTPFLTASFDGIYRTGQWRFNFGGKYYDDIYVNTLNTQPLDSYTLFDAGVSYSGKRDTALEGYKVSLSIYNLFDDYIWLARGYNDEDGQVLADRGRMYTLKCDLSF